MCHFALFDVDPKQNPFGICQILFAVLSIGHFIDSIVNIKVRNNIIYIAAPGHRQKRFWKTTTKTARAQAAIRTKQKQKSTDRCGIIKRDKEMKS